MEEGQDWMRARGWPDIEGLGVGREGKLGMPRVRGGLELGFRISCGAWCEQPNTTSGEHLVIL